MLKGHGNTNTGVACSIDGKHIASGGADGMVRLWDSATGQLLQERHSSSGMVLCVAFSPDGKRLAAGGQATVDIWNVADGSALQSFAAHADYVTSVAFSPDGKTLATAGMIGRSLSGTRPLVDRLARCPMGRASGCGRL